MKVDSHNRIEYVQTMTAARVQKALQSLKKLPVKVHSWKVEEGYDATGDFAFWVWITVDDRYLNRENRNKLREIVRDRVSRLEPAIAPWVYVRFRGTSELKVN